MGFGTSLQDRIAKMLRRNGCMTTVIHAGRFGHAGWPDVLAAVPPDGHLLAIEVKRPDETVSKLQKETIRRLRKVGATVIIAHNLADARQGLQDARERSGRRVERS